MSSSKRQFNDLKEIEANERAMLDNFMEAALLQGTEVPNLDNLRENVKKVHENYCKIHGLPINGKS